MGCGRGLKGRRWKKRNRRMGRTRVGRGQRGECGERGELVEYLKRFLVFAWGRRIWLVGLKTKNEKDKGTVVFVWLKDGQN